MSIKRNLLTGAATLTIAAGVFSLGTPSASAATPACGADCISIFSRELGTYGQPNVVEAVLDGVARVGQPVILAPASSSDPSQDLIPTLGRVSDFYAQGMVSAEVNRHYGNLDAAQIQYAPFGVVSGLCVGLAKPAFQGAGLTLQPCTVPGTTVFIIDMPNATADGYFPIQRFDEELLPPVRDALPARPTGERAAASADPSPPPAVPRQGPHPA